MTHEQVEPINTTNTVLVVQQNKQLVEYTNKLKLQLAKSYTAIQKAENLQKKYSFKTRKHRTKKRK